MITESIRRFQEPIYCRVQRSEETYRTVKRHCVSHLERLAKDYHMIVEEDEFDAGQLRREIRNDMDYYLRRYHKYCIEERLKHGKIKGAHYREIGADDEVDFEHLIPASTVRDLYLFGEITVEQALNAPTVVLSRQKHVALKDAGWSDSTPDLWLPFQRYRQVFSARFETFDGQEIDQENWTLQNHYDHFGYI